MRGCVRAYESECGEHAGRMGLHACACVNHKLFNGMEEEKERDVAFLTLSRPAS